MIRNRAIGGTMRRRRLWSGVLGLVLLVMPIAAPAADVMIGLRVAESVGRGDYAGAAAAVDAALAGESDPRVRIDLLRQLAGLRESAGDVAGAAAAARAAVDAIGQASGENAPERIDALAEAARLLTKAGDPGAAVEALAEALAITRTLSLPAAAAPLLDALEALRTSAAGAAADAAISLHETETAAREEEAARAFDLDPEKGFTTVRIYYATDRARSGSEAPNDFYSGERGSLELGTAAVSIPAQHQPGRIEKPSIWTLDFFEDPERHVVLRSVTPGSAEAVFSEMRAQLGQSERKEAFVFVHGFNVPFHEAAKRTAQMAYDMNFEGLPILYSWPSRGSIMSYISDTAVVNLSGRRLSRFLEDVVARSGATRIHLIAHSMGNRAMTDALELYALRHQGAQPAFDQVLFTAPDLDAGLFAEMMETIRPTARRITLYASDQDWALTVSRHLHGDAPRAGEAGRTILHVADIDSIDMTEIGEDMLKHSYYANDPSALADILSLFWRNAPPKERCGMRVAEGENGAYWHYDPKKCDTSAMLSTLTVLRRASIATFSEASRFMANFVVPKVHDPAERARLQRALEELFGG